MFPCVGDLDLWFAEEPVELERAKALCAACPTCRCAWPPGRARLPGVWGGEILRAAALARSPRGRPRKDVVAA